MYQTSATRFASSSSMSWSQSSSMALQTSSAAGLMSARLSSQSPPAFTQSFPGESQESVASPAPYPSWSASRYQATSQPLPESSPFPESSPLFVLESSLPVAVSSLGVPPFESSLEASSHADSHRKS